MILYGFVFSPFVMRPLLIARAKGSDLEATPPHEGNPRSDAYLAINPLGKIPCLVDGDLILPESAVIADYLDAVLPGPTLWPTEPRARVRVALLARIVDSYLVPGSFENLLGTTTGDAARKERGRETLANGLNAIEHFRAGDTEWLAGESFGPADAAILPILFATDYFSSQTGLGEVCAGQPGLAAYWARALGTPLVARMATEMRTGFDAMLAARAQAS